MTLQESTRSRRRQPPPTNARDLLRRIRDRFQQESKEQIGQRFADAILDYPDIAAEVAIMFVQLNWTSLFEPPKARNTRTPEERLEQNQKLQKVGLARVAMIVSLNMMIGDKKLRDMTFGECAEIGGQITNLASKGRADQKVGEVLRTDAQLKKALAP